MAVRMDAKAPDHFERATGPVGTTFGTSWSVKRRIETPAEWQRRRVARLCGQYPGLPRTVAARLLRRADAGIDWRAMRHDSAQARRALDRLWLGPSPLGGVMREWDAYQLISGAFGIPARLLEPDGDQNATAERELLGYPMRVRGDS